MQTKVNQFHSSCVLELSLKGCKGRDTVLEFLKRSDMLNMLLS